LIYNLIYLTEKRLKHRN